MTTYSFIQRTTSMSILSFSQSLTMRPGPHASALVMLFDDRLRRHIPSLPARTNVCLPSGWLQRVISAIGRNALFADRPASKSRNAFCARLCTCLHLTVNCTPPTLRSTSLGDGFSFSARLILGLRGSFRSFREARIEYARH